MRSFCQLGAGDHLGFEPKLCAHLASSLDCGSVLGLEQPLEVALDHHGDACEHVVEVLPDVLASLVLEALPQWEHEPAPLALLVVAEARDLEAVRVVRDLGLELLAGARDLRVVVLEEAGMLNRLLAGDGVPDREAVCAVALDHLVGASPARLQSLFCVRP